jgi:hypothetical protein
MPLMADDSRGGFREYFCRACVEVARRFLMWGTAPLPTTKCHRVVVAFESHQGAVHMQVTTIGLDIAKNVFQVHGIDAAMKAAEQRFAAKKKIV